MSPDNTTALSASPYILAYLAFTLWGVILGAPLGLFLGWIIWA